jgi:integrase
VLKGKQCSAETKNWSSNIVIKHGAGGLIALHNLHPAEPFALLCWHTNILLALETAIRRSEIAELRWRFIDLEKRVAHLPDTKNGNARDVPFSTKAITILSSLKEHSKQTTDKVFDMRADAIIRAFLSIPVLVPRTFLPRPASVPAWPEPVHAPALKPPR